VCQKKDFVCASRIGVPALQSTASGRDLVCARDFSGPSDLDILRHHSDP
jgi:hypothetical protein